MIDVIDERKGRETFAVEQQAFNVQVRRRVVVNGDGQSALILIPMDDQPIERWTTDEITRRAREWIQTHAGEQKPRRHRAVVVVAWQTIGLSGVGVIQQPTSVLLSQIGSIGVVELPDREQVVLIAGPVVRIGQQCRLPRLTSFEKRVQFANEILPATEKFNQTRRIASHSNIVSREVLIYHLAWS